LLKKVYILPIAAVALIAAVMAVHCRRAVVVTSPSYILMGTTVSITAVAGSRSQADNAISKAVEKIKALERILSYYDESSELNTVNTKAFEEEIQISDELFEVIEKAVHFYELTNGAFDCTVAPILEIWRSYSKRGQSPPQSALDQAQPHIGSDKIILNKNKQTIRLATPKMRLDLGGIAKGYAVDKAIEAIRACGIEGGLIDAGGDIRCFGRLARGKSQWFIGLQNPSIDSKENIILKFAIEDKAIATSGNYYRFVIAGEKKISHIINPALKNSAEGLSSVSIIAAEATIADALSTAVTVLGGNRGIELINSMPDVEALIITDDGNFIKSSGVDAYIR
jgi:FAD:protein FMN transferase